MEENNFARRLTNAELAQLRKVYGNLTPADVAELEDFKERIGPKYWYEHFGTVSLRKSEEAYDRNGRIYGPDWDDLKNGEILPHWDIHRELVDVVHTNFDDVLALFRIVEYDWEPTLQEPALISETPSSYDSPAPEVQYGRALACLDGPNRFLCNAYQEQNVSTVILEGPKRGNWRRGKLLNPKGVAKAHREYFSKYGYTIKAATLSQIYAGKTDRWAQGNPDGLLWKFYVLGHTDGDLLEELFWLGSLRPNRISISNGTIESGFIGGNEISRSKSPVQLLHHIKNFIRDDDFADELESRLPDNYSHLTPQHIVESLLFDKFLKDRWALQRKLIKRLCKDYIKRYRDNTEPKNPLTSKYVRNEMEEFFDPYIRLGLVEDDIVDSGENIWDNFTDSKGYTYEANLVQPDVTIDDAYYDDDNI